MKKTKKIRKRQEKNQKVKVISSCILCILSVLLIALLIYIKKNYKDATFEQILYSFLYSEGTSISAIGEGMIFCGSITLVFSSIILFPWIYKSKTINIVNFNIKNRKYSFQIFPFKKEKIFKFFLLEFLICLILFINGVGFFNYLKFKFDKSKIFEKYYINPIDVNVEFNNDNKKNLIYIFVESAENAGISKENGGTTEESYIPNLENFALNNINFSNVKKLGGALQIDGLGWTAAGMIGQTSGVPIKMRIDANKYYKKYSNMPGAYSLGEILDKNGYKNYLMLGSKAKFGGRKDYFTSHGNYKIYDYNWAKKGKLISKKYYEWWGYEDSKLFKFAKNKLLEISEKEEPFNFTILTADTHFPDGYVDKKCKDDLFNNNHYASSFYCSDSMIGEFVDWIQEQDFYDDTVIVIVGDHLTMQSDFYNISDKNYKRTVYNAIINSAVEPKHTKNRLFTTMDMYPTTLAAMGAKIDGDRLGLGTNLFSGKKTIIEKLGFDYVNEEISKKSTFYDNYILGNSYKEMLTK